MNTLTHWDLTWKAVHGWETEGFSVSVEAREALALAQAAAVRFFERVNVIDRAAHRLSHSISISICGEGLNSPAPVAATVIQRAAFEFIGNVGLDQLIPLSQDLERYEAEAKALLDAEFAKYQEWQKGVANPGYVESEATA